MQITLLNGYPDFMGRRMAFAGYGNGPSNYTAGADDPITVPGYERYIDSVAGGVISTDGTTVAMAHPSGYGPRQTWNLQYYVASSMAQASGDLSGKVFQIGGFFGNY